MSAGAPPARLRLTVAEGPLAGLKLESDRPRPRLTLGRSAKTAQLQIKDPLVSERHAVFAWREGRWHLSDVGSTNGSFVNGSEQRLEEGAAVAISSGDRIRFGEVSIVDVEVIEPSAAAESAAAEMTVEEYLLAEVSLLERKLLGHGDELADGLRAELARRRPELLAAVR